MIKAVKIVKRLASTPGCGVYAVFGASTNRKRLAEGRGLVHYWYHLDDPNDAASSRALAYRWARCAGCEVIGEIDLMNKE